MRQKKNLERPLRILFFAWGYSIHAERRIRIFTEDPSFSVGLVSTWEYNFPGVPTILVGRKGRRPTHSGSEENHMDNSETKRSITDLRRSFLRPLLLWVWNSFVLQFVRDIVISIKDLFQLRRFADTFNPDLIFLQTLLYPSYLSFFLPRRLPIAITFWNGDIIWWARWNGIERMLKKQIVHYGVKRARLITVNSETARDACYQYYSIGGSVHLIRYPGVDLKLFRPRSKHESQAKLGLTARKVVFAPRGLGGYLNSDVILEAIALVAKECPEVLFLFVCGYVNTEALDCHQKRAAELGIERNIRWDGCVDWKKMPVYYAASDVMVSISSNDSLPNCMLESMACGVPLVIGDIPPLREWVQHGVNGYLVPPRDSRTVADAILDAVLDRKGWNVQFVQYNIELVKNNFDSAQNIAKLKTLVFDVMSNSPDCP